MRKDVHDVKSSPSSILSAFFSVESSQVHIGIASKLGQHRVDNAYKHRRLAGGWIAGEEK